MEPSVSTALRRLTTAPWRTSSRTPTASASVITGSRPSGTLPTSSPTANTTASLSDSPAPSIAIGTNAIPVTTAISAISQATRRTWCSSGLSSFSTRSESAAMRPSSVRIPVANTTARASPSGARRPAEHEVARLQQRQVDVVERGRAERRQRLARERREVDLERAAQQPGVGGDAIALLDHQDVAGHEPGGLDDLPLTVAHDGGVRRQVGLERLDRALGLALLRERERRVDDDHDDDRDRHRHDPRRPGQTRGRPQQQRQRVRELRRELPRPAPATAAPQLVGAVDDQPPRRLAVRQPPRPGAQVAQQ